MSNCEYAENAFNNCRTDCKYKGHEWECPIIQDYYRKKENE